MVCCGFVALSVVFKQEVSLSFLFFGGCHCCDRTAGQAISVGLPFTMVALNRFSDSVPKCSLRSSFALDCLI